MSQSVRSEAARAYWRANIRLATILLAVWALVSFGFGIVLRPVLDQVSLGGAPLGFWFAQQGAIYVFVALIFVYSWRMSVLERRYGDAARGEAGEAE